MFYWNQTFAACLAGRQRTTWHTQKSVAVASGPASWKRVNALDIQSPHIEVHRRAHLSGVALLVNDSCSPSINSIRSGALRQTRELGFQPLSDPGPTAGYGHL